MVLAVDIGGTRTKYALFEADGRLTGLETFDTAPDRFVEELVARLRAMGGDAVGVAIAGFLDSRRDRLVYNPNLPWLEGVPLRDLLQDALGVSVRLEVDSNAACLAEHRLGAGRGSHRFLNVTVGTGVGVGMIVDGELLRFAYQCMGDAGHVVVAPDGPVCACGGRGCAEALVSQAARAGAFAEAGRWLGRALASLATIFYPDRIAIAGGVAEAAGDVLIFEAEAEFRRLAPPFASTHVRVVPAEMGARATLVGAGIAANPSI